MQLTIELVFTLVASTAAGATAAYFGNRITNAELYAHVRRHCTELERAFREIARGDDRQRDHDRRIVAIEYQHEIDARESRS